jgi:trimeric autotransporter adhesin
MKKFLLILSLLAIAGVGYSQTTYYWVGDNNDSINVLSNWNTVLNGTGNARPSNTNAADILVFDGVSISGNPFTVGSTGAISCAQLKFINGANVNITRTASGGTTVITMAGDVGDDFFVDANSKVGFTATLGSVRIDMSNICTGRVNGEMRTITIQQFRITNTTTGPAGTFVFPSGSKFYTNITGSSSYAFGSSSQGAEGWVVFEAGAHLYYDGGNSPFGSGGGFSAINMKPGSVWHHRATNTVSTAGNFFNRKTYGDVVVENNATLLQLGSIYRMENLTVTAGSIFTTASSGQLVVAGNILADGDITSPAASSLRLVLAGSSAQTVSGAGTIAVGNFTVADKANVTLNKNISVEGSTDIYGKINFGTNQITGNAGFNAVGIETAIPGTGNFIAGRYFITGNTAYNSSSIGKTISGTGISPNTSIVSFSATSDSMYISQPLLSTASGVSLLAATSGATLETANTNGFDPATGSAASAGNKVYGNGINYIINAVTTIPFGISTGSTANKINTGFVELNAAVTANTGATVSDHFTLNGKFTLRSTDTLHLLTGAVLNGTYNASNYIATGYNLSTDAQGLLKYDGVNNGVVLPVGTTQYYLPVTVTATGTADYTASVFEGITKEGILNGTAFIGSEKLTVVNAVWQINRSNGTGNADLQIGWDAALEGATFTTLPDTDIGLITNNGSSWSLPSGTANNTNNTVTATITNFGSFSVGAIPQVDPFVFNPLPAKTYGDADFNGGATSLNTTSPIEYASSNTAVATIVNGNIHITGAGTANITASQASNGFYPAASVTQALTVAKTPLLIKADNKIKFEGLANPTLTATYTGLVLLETPAVLLTPAVITTTATTGSAPGTYPITVNGATSNNYTITFEAGVLTVQPKQNQTITFNAPATKTYGNADFSAGASSSNNTIPITYTSSNTSVATINAAGVIHIVGAGTTNITASQAGNDGYFPATNVVRTLTVNKANLTIKALDTSKIEGSVNPQFTITYTGFVLGETSTNLTTAAEAVTLAGNSSIPGHYTIVVQGATSSNYNIIYVTGRLTILPLAGTDKQHLNAFVNSSGNLYVRVYSPIPRLGDIIVFDMNGRPLVQRNIFMPTGFIQVEVFIPKLTTGMYVVTVKGDGVDLKQMINVIKQ